MPEESLQCWQAIPFCAAVTLNVCWRTCGETLLLICAVRNGERDALLRRGRPFRIQRVVAGCPQTLHNPRRGSFRCPLIASWGAFFLRRYVFDSGNDEWPQRLKRKTT